MNTEELTNIATAHQSAISRHEQWFAEHQQAIAQHDAQMAQINATLTANAQQQAKNTQAIAQLTAEGQLSRQAINELTAGLVDLRVMVADYIQSRSKTV